LVSPVFGQRGQPSGSERTGWTKLNARQSSSWLIPRSRSRGTIGDGAQYKVTGQWLQKRQRFLSLP
jgi:hypothetical protein